MSFKEQQANWEALAETDPLWAVLSEPAKRGGGWDRREFYETGTHECWDVANAVGDLELPFGGKESRALDVGCGPGRICHALTYFFAEVVGYDISERMLAMAREEATPEESYVLNETDDLSPFDDESFDFVYCSKVLQHVDPQKVGDYMAEMMRVLKRGGVLFLQMLSHPTGWVGTKESGPDPSWGKNGEKPPHYTVLSVQIDAMIVAFLHLRAIIHQVRLVEGGKGQSIFSYDYIVQRRGDLPEGSIAFGEFGTFNQVKIGGDWKQP